MGDYKFVQCINPDCHLRMPIDLSQFSGKYCPRCGGPMQVAAESQSGSIVDREIPRPKRPLLLILDNIRSAYNVGGIFRTADGIGVKKLYLCGITPTPKTTGAVGKTALGAENTIPWEYHPNGVTVAQNLRNKSYNLLALERTAAAQLINDYSIDPFDQRTTVLVIGNEKAGVDPGIIAVCDDVIALPMMGEKASLNVAVALGAAAYWLSFI